MRSGATRKTSSRRRLRSTRLGATTFIVIADYQVLTDRETTDAVAVNVQEAIVDCLAPGLDPENGRIFFFSHSHSHVPEAVITLGQVRRAMRMDYGLD